MLYEFNLTLGMIRSDIFLGGGPESSVESVMPHPKNTFKKNDQCQILFSYRKVII